MTEISNEYASALFMLALEEGKKKEYADALARISDIFASEPDYMEFLASPSIAKDERTAAVEAAFGNAEPEYVVSFLKLLCEKGRIRSFPECVSEYRKLLEESERTAVAKVTSALELTDEEKKALTEKLEKTSGKRITLECRVDKSIIGGLIMEIDGKVMDGSVRSKLADVKDVITR